MGWGWGRWKIDSVPEIQLVFIKKLSEAVQVNRIPKLRFGFGQAAVFDLDFSRTKSFVIADAADQMQGEKGSLDIIAFCDIGNQGIVRKHYRLFERQFFVQ